MNARSIFDDPAVAAHLSAVVDTAPPLTARQATTLRRVLTRSVDRCVDRDERSAA